MSAIGICKCGHVLVYQLYFKQLQYICLNCGRLAHTPPRAQPSTPELEAKWRALEAEFMMNCGSKLIVEGMYRQGCELCDRDQEHWHHATEAEWRDCNDAIHWLSERTGRAFALVNARMTWSQMA